MVLDKILTEKISFIDLGNIIGQENKKYYLNRTKSENKNWNLLEKERVDSLKKQEILERKTNQSFDSFKKEFYQ